MDTFYALARVLTLGSGVSVGLYLGMHILEKYAFIQVDPVQTAL